jgi:solute carrier family 31 (copper transporter), member 1
LFEVLAVIKGRRGGEYPYAVEVKATTRPWRVNEAVVLASMDVVLAGIGYLLSVLTIILNSKKGANWVTG